jgi:hypothetical protein
LNAGIDPVSPFKRRSLNEQTVSARERTNDENITKTPKTNRAITQMCVCAYTKVSEGNAFRLDSENADEIVEGSRRERSPFELQATPEMQSGKLEEEQLNVEFARHTEAL